MHMIQRKLILAEFVIRQQIRRCEIAKGLYFFVSQQDILLSLPKVVLLDGQGEDGMSPY